MLRDLVLSQFNIVAEEVLGGTESVQGRNTRGELAAPRREHRLLDTRLESGEFRADLQLRRAVRGQILALRLRQFREHFAQCLPVTVLVKKLRRRERGASTAQLEQVGRREQ